MVFRQFKIRIIRRYVSANAQKVTSDPWTILNIKRDATREEIKNGFIQLARVYHPDNNPSPDAAGKFQMLQEAYLEAIKHAKTGPDRNRAEKWNPENIKKSYSTLVEVPEYSKVIEAENIQSQIDTEAEFNRDPALVRQYFLIVTVITVVGLLAYSALLAPQMGSEAEEFLENLQKEKQSILVPYAKKKIDEVVAAKK